jgi:hypothetical protein
MGLQNSDIILVERNGTLYRETYGNRANIDSSDLLLVERPPGSVGTGTMHQCTYANFSSAQNTDLILVERSGSGGYEMYKETKSAWDFSTSSYKDIHSANYMVTLGTLLYGQSSTQLASNYFSVVEVQAEFSSSATVGDGSLYIGFRNSAGTGGFGSSTYAYYGDLPIAAFQILKSNGTTVSYAYNFATWAADNQNTIYNDWSTTDSSQDSPPGDGVITSKTADPGDFTFTNIGAFGGSSDNGERKFSFTEDGTASSFVGAELGISSTTYTNATSTTVLPVGNANIPQSSSSGDGYIFSECSSTQQGDLTWLGVQLYGDDLDNGDRIRICYFGGGNGQTSSRGLKTTNSLYLKYVED